MLAVRKKVIIGMRDDLQSRGIKVPPTDPSGGFASAQGETEGRNWVHPFPREAVTEPQGQFQGQFHGQAQGPVGQVVRQQGYGSGYGNDQIKPRLDERR